MRADARGKFHRKCEVELNSFINRSLRVIVTICTTWCMGLQRLCTTIGLPASVSSLQAVCWFKYST